MLSKAQSAWMLNRLKEFLGRNLLSLPIQNEDWNRIWEEAAVLEKLSRKDPDCVKWITQTLLYLEKMDELCKEGTK